MRNRLWLATLALLAGVLGLRDLSAQRAGPHIPIDYDQVRNIVPDHGGELPIEPVAPGQFRIGKVILSQKDKIIAFPATLNMTNGIVEYALVTLNGKVHESILRTETQPYEIHVAMLLLGVNSTNVPAQKPSGVAPQPAGQVDVPGAIVPPGEGVLIEVSWQEGGKKVTRRLAELVQNTKAEGAPQGHPWIYNGSRMGEGRFLAQLTGSIISLITDGDALINNSSEGHEDDTIWQVDPKTIPPPKIPVQVTIRLAASTGK